MTPDNLESRPRSFREELRYLLLGMSSRHRLLVVALRTSDRHARAGVQHGGRQRRSGAPVKKQLEKRALAADRDTMRAEYDFSDGRRGATVTRYTKVQTSW